MFNIKQRSTRNGGRVFAELSPNWWWLALRGIAAILFGILALAWPGATVRALMLLFSGFALVVGLLAGFAVRTNRAGKRRWWILLQGLLSVAIVILSVLWTESTASILLNLVAAWALITGILELVGAWELRRNISNDWLLTLSGIASISFAVLVILFPKIGVLSVARTVAVFAILFGLLNMALGLNIRSMQKYAHLMSRPRADLPSSKEIKNG